LQGHAPIGTVERVFDALDRALTALAELATEARAGWPAEAQSERVRGLAELRDRVEAELVRAVGQWDAERAWEADGALNPGSWLAGRTPMARAAANQLVRSARLVREHDATAEALADGTVSAAHVAILATATRNREDLYAEGEAEVLSVAATLTPEQFTRAARYWRSLADDAAAAEDAYAVHERRCFHLSKTLFSTMDLAGELDLDGGEIVCSALAAAIDEGRGDLVTDSRTAGQRNADALVQIAAAYLARGDADGRPAIAASVVVDLDRLVGRLHAEGEGVRCELSHLGPIARETALRLTCDAVVIRTIMAGRSEPLDLGRGSRTPSLAQRRALVVRDGGCVFPECDRPASWCDAHHVLHWTKGGPTDLWNLVLLCRRHHVMCHEGGWQLARAPDGTIRVERPDGTERRAAA
jgi:hypothetical protein